MSRLLTPAFVLLMALAAGPPASSAPMSGPATMAASRADTSTDEADAREARARHAAARMMVLLVTALTVVLATLVAWILRWGRRLRQPTASRRREPSGTEDPWQVAGQRLDAPDEEDRSEDSR